MLDNGRWSAAYYLLGYAVETCLKACILKLIEETGVIFTDRKFGEKCWTHSAEVLVEQADLAPQRGRDRGANNRLNRHWSVVESWKEDSRYQQRSEAEARELFDAVTDDPDGVFPWIQQHW